MKIDKRLKIGENGTLVPKKKNFHSKAFLLKQYSYNFNKLTEKWDVYTLVNSTIMCVGSFLTKEKAEEATKTLVNILTCNI